jgi:transposase
MIVPSAGVRVLLWSRPVHFRKGHDGLAALVQEALRHDPFCGDIFIFRSRRHDRVKIVTWDGSGLCLFYKRCEQGRFTWPPIRDRVATLSPAQLTMLLAGLDWTRVQPRAVAPPRAAC